MSQHEAILEFFRSRGGKARLGEILQHPFGYEFRARASELRQQGYKIECIKADKASDNLYCLTEPTKFYNGQGVLL